MTQSDGDMPLLTVDDLCVDLRSNRKSQRVVHNLSFQVRAGEILALVGESGSGKSITAKALMGLLPNGSDVSGYAYFQGQDILAPPSDKNGVPIEKLRGAAIGMIFQEPMTALNPVLTIGTQLTEALLIHGQADERTANNLAVDMLQRVGISDAENRLRQYPHEFSGGMRQRVLIAMTMLLKPKLIIADEPTTALDVTIQAQILDLLKDLVTEHNIGLILITHDMGVVAETADHVLVLKAGRVKENEAVYPLFKSAKNPYTQALLQAVPRLDQDISDQAVKGQASANTSILKIRNLSKTFTSGGFFRKRKVQTTALDDLSLDVFMGETLAVVGESGSGKSTLGRALMRLISVDQGSIEMRTPGQVSRDAINLLDLKGKALRRARRHIQMVFQDPYASLDPRVKIGKTIEEPMTIHSNLHAKGSGPDRKKEVDLSNAQRVQQLLVRVGLSEDMAERYPHEFSGGQRQRIAIARALACNPKILVADEPTSALDVSVQAQVLDLLEQLKQDLGLTMIFISHDLAVVNKIADRVAVMRQGQIVELGLKNDVLKSPQHAYTKALIHAAPIPDPDKRRARNRPDLDTVPVVQSNINASTLSSSTPSSFSSSGQGEVS